MGHDVVGPISFVAGIVLLAAVGSRLLGLRLSWRRALLTGFPSLVAGFVAGYLVNRRHPGQITPPSTPIRTPATSSCWAPGSSP